MDNTIILSRIALIAIFAISITVLVAVVIYLWRQRRESKSLRIKIDAIDDKLSEHIVALTKRANHAHENIVALIDSQNIQRAGLDATAEALTQHTVNAVAEFKKIAKKRSR